MAFAALGQGDEAADLFSMLNPINSTRSRTGVLRYKVEPYVVAADVYSNPAHIGRGGWTWYTGSAGWMQRAGVEAILGLQISAGNININPCIPADWPGFSITFRHNSTTFEISVENPDGSGRGVQKASLDGAVLPPGSIQVPLVDDGLVHRLVVILGT